MPNALETEAPIREAWMRRTGKNIEALREMRNLSQVELGERIGFKKARIGSYEEYRCIPPPWAAMKLATFFGVTMEELYTEDINRAWILNKRNGENQ